MPKLELNKILAAVLVTAIIMMVANLTGDGLYHPQPSKNYAYPPPGSMGGEMQTASSSQQPLAMAGSQSDQQIANQKIADNDNLILSMIADADPAKGRVVARKCTACHSFQEGGANKVGPNLWDILGAPKAKKSGFRYSKALIALGGVWDYQALNAFIKKPRAYVRGTKMAFAGISSDRQRADLIAYIRQLSGNPQPLP